VLLRGGRKRSPRFTVRTNKRAVCIHARFTVDHLKKIMLYLDFWVSAHPLGSV
jgi:hypothetical protein